jgi:twitching motility protein PilT
MAKIDDLFDELVKRGGSDLHIAPGYPATARIHGELVALGDDPLDAKVAAEMLVEIMTPVQRARLQSELDLDFTYAYKDVARFRANAFAKSSGFGAVFRHVPVRLLSLAELGCPEVLWRLADRRSGLVLVTGPSRSGKSTTIAAMLDHINKTRACHILTIEEPLEFVHEPLRAQITHREVGYHASSFVSALRSAVRENPDVVFTSELRGNEAVRLALQLASYGVLVFATVTTNGAEQTIERLVSAFPADEQPQLRALFAESLAGVVSQQLLRTAEGKGYVAAHEVLVTSPAAATAIREAKTNQLGQAMEAGQAQGMQTMDLALERLMTAGKISPEDALEHAFDRETFAHVVARVNPDFVDGSS